MRIFFVALISMLLVAGNSYARPYVSGDVLMQLKTDRIMSTNKSGVSPNNAYVYLESNMALNLDKNWSVKTQLRSMPNNTLTTRNSTYPERYRTFLGQNRGLSQNNDLMIEEIKINFKNEDMQFVAGKFDPTFGTAYDKKKRIGVFTNEFAEDYNLREKIGAGITGYFENSKISFNTFFNDTTGLSSSMINNRGRAVRNEGIAGNTGTLTSYSLSMEGDTLFGVEDLYYNAGYRNLAVTKQPGRSNEQGYVVGLEYLYRLGYKTSLIPFFEAVKLKNFTGAQGRDAMYTTTALIAKYSSWTASVSILSRSIKEVQAIPKSSDKYTQLSVGYKFSDNLAFDVTRSDVKEAGYKGAMIGAALTYLYKF